MDTETEQQQERDAEATKLQEGFMLRRYAPQQGRADRLKSNIPGQHGDSN